MRTTNKATIQATTEGELSDILESNELTVVASGLTATEGPVWHPEGFLTFVDLRQDQLLRWSRAEGLQVMRAPNGEGNGCTLDCQGRMLMCESGMRRIIRRETDGSWTTLADHWAGKRLNRPNDIVCRSDGTIYFSDPILTVPKAQRDLDHSIVWRRAPDGSLHVAARDCGFPNGVALSPDERVLYVSNSFLDEGCFGERDRKDTCAHRFLAAYDVNPDGTLANFRKFVDMTSNAHSVPDGMRVDRNGIIFCTGSGATWVIAPDGEVLGKIITPDSTRNCAFGGADYRTLFLTAMTTVYSLRVRTPGIGKPQPRR
jgi:gluconolactonase